MSSAFTERPLRHVMKKGRPVSQCTHCRVLRKSRSAHVKCVCAEHGIITKEGKANGMFLCSRYKCLHAIYTDINLGEVHCQCGNGAPCSCSIKKEILDTDDVSRLAAYNSTHRRAQSLGIPKPLILNRRSDGAIPKLQNGLHPPLHRLNNAAQEYGHPYPPMRRLQGPVGQLDGAMRSVDSLLPLANTSFSQPPFRQHQYPDFTTPHELGRVMETDPDSPTQTPMSSSFSVTPNPLPTLNLPPNLIYQSTSPANPARFSLNDFSAFNFNNVHEQFNDQPLLSSAAEGPPEDWTSWQAKGPYGNQSFMNSSEVNLQRSSVVSFDQPGLSHSPSYSTSDTGESSINPADLNHAIGLQNRAYMNPSWAAKSADDLYEPSSYVFPPPSNGSMYQTSNASASNFDDYFASSNTASNQPDAFKSQPAGASTLPMLSNVDTIDSKDFDGFNVPATTRDENEDWTTPHPQYENAAMGMFNEPTEYNWNQ